MAFTRHFSLVERTFELDRLRSGLSAAAEGRGGVVAIEGPPGIGKTRLGEETVSLATAFSVLRATGSELEQDFAFGVARQLFEPVLAGAGSDRRRGVLDGAAAFAAVPLGLPGAGSSLTGADARFAAIHGLHWLTANLAGEAPLLLWVDDLQWADASSRRFLAYVSRRIAGLPVLLVVASRPPLPDAEQPEAVAIAAAPGTLVLEPAPLSADGIATLVRERFGSAADADFVAECCRATGGNVLLLEALLGELGRPDPDAVRALGGTGRVARGVQRRLAMLPAPAREPAGAVAILGDGHGLEVATALAGLPADEGGRAADVLVAADLLRHDPSLRFRHPLVRAAVADALSPVARSAAHGRAARLLADRGAPAAVVAAHLLASPADGEAWALDVLRAAGRESLGQGAPEQAARLLARALEQDPPGDVRPDVLLALAQAEHDAGLPTAAGRLREALELVADPLERARIGLQLATVLSNRLRWREAADVGREALLAAEKRDRELELTLRAVLADCVRMEPALGGDEPGQLARLAATLAGDTRAERLVLATAASIEPTDTAAAHAAAAELMDRSAQLDAGGATPLETGIVSNLIRAGRLDGAATVVARVIDQARSRGLVQRHGLMLAMRGWIALERGELAAAEEDLREALDLAEDTGQPPTAIAPLLAFALAERGELAAADAVLERCGAAGPLPEQQTMNPALHTRARVRLAQGRDADALADALEVGRRYDRLCLRRAVPPWRSTAAVLLARRGEGARALELAEEELALARRWDTPAARGIALRGLGLVRGDLGLLAAAVDELEGSPWRLELARAAIDLGAALRRDGRRVESRGPLRLGMDVAQACGAVPLAERARTELVASGARPRRLALSGAGSLTASERRVAELAAAGRTNRQIAQDLFVTTSTVETHLRHAFRKLDVGSRAQLVDALRERGGRGARSMGGMDTTNIRELAIRCVQMMGDADRAEFNEVLHPDFLNHEARDEPPAARRRGPDGAWATALWLRDAFEGLEWEIHDVVVEGGLAVVHCTMSGRHVRPFAGYDEQARVKEVFPPTGRRFASTQTHWLRVADGRIVEHWANRDDLGMAVQCGWVPPWPLYLLRSALAKRRATRARKQSARSARVGARAVAGALLAVVLASALVADAQAAGSHWQRQVDTSFDAKRLGLAKSAGADRLARAAVRRASGELVERRALGGLMSVGSFAPPKGAGRALRLVRLRQSLEGRRVLWSQLSVLVSGNSVTSISGTVVPLTSRKVAGSRRLSAARAQQVAQRAVAGPDRALRAQAVVYAGEPERPRRPRHAFVVEVQPASASVGGVQGDEPGALCVVVDARTGKVLKTWSGRAALPQSSPRPERRPARARAAQQKHYLIQVADNASTAVSLSNHGVNHYTTEDPYQWGPKRLTENFGTPSSAFKETNGAALFGRIAMVTRHFCVNRKHCGRDGGQPGGVGGGDISRWFFSTRFKGCRDGICTTHYDPALDRIFLENGDDADPDVVAHEVGHVIDRHWRDDYIETWEGSEVKEALSEMFAYDFSYKNATITGLATINQRLGSPNTYSNPQRMEQYKCSHTDVHTNGYILGHAYWRWIERMNALGLPGREIAGQILTYIPMNLPAKRTFGAVRQSFANIVALLHGNTSSVEAAFWMAFTNDAGILLSHSRKQLGCSNE